MDPTWFAGRLRELREKAGLTQQQLADATGLTKDGIARLERGARSPVWETVVSLCKALDTTCDAFLQEPVETAPRPKGRPRKADAEAKPTPPPAKKKGRGKK
jgi:transcriptional regulator with XRE-family HTH domain